MYKTSSYRNNHYKKYIDIIATVDLTEWMYTCIRARKKNVNIGKPLSEGFVLRDHACIFPGSNGIYVIRKQHYVNYVFQDITNTRIHGACI